MARNLSFTGSISQKRGYLPRVFSQVIYSGGYSDGEPPLPIPNREAKPVIADGTARPGGRVGSCRVSRESLRVILATLFLFIPQSLRDSSQEHGESIPRHPFGRVAPSNLLATAFSCLSLSQAIRCCTHHPSDFQPLQTTVCCP